VDDIAVDGGDVETVVGENGGYSTILYGEGF
jgi:hypothetical protein